MYIDTSCLLAYYAPEQHSLLAQEKIRSANQLYVSFITDVEFLSAIKKKKRLQEIVSRDAEQIYDLFKNHRIAGFYKVIELTPSVFQASEFILQKTSSPLRTLDAIHLGITYHYKLELFSFDQVLLNAAREFNIKTLEYS